MTDHELTTVDRKDFKRLDGVVRKGMATFLQVGSALKEINDRFLYKVTHTNFEDYLRERHDMSRGHAYRLIECEEIRERLSPIGDKTPLLESHYRELARVEDDCQVTAWKHVLDAGEPITAKLIREQVTPFVAEEEPPRFALAEAIAKLRRYTETLCDSWPKEHLPDLADELDQLAKELRDAS